MKATETAIEIGVRVLLEAAALLIWVFGTASFVSAPGFIRPVGAIAWTELVVIVGVTPIVLSGALFAFADRKIRSPKRTFLYAISSWICLWAGLILVGGMLRLAGRL